MVEVSDGLGGFKIAVNSDATQPVNLTDPFHLEAPRKLYQSDVSNRS